MFGRSNKFQLILFARFVRGQCYQSGQDGAGLGSGLHQGGQVQQDI